VLTAGLKCDTLSRHPTPTSTPATRTENEPPIPTTPPGHCQEHRVGAAPRGDAVLVAPATFNTINKVAVGLNDTLALGLINEAIGSQSVPIAFVPWVNLPLSGHPAYHPSLTAIRSAGAHIVELAAHNPKRFGEAIASTSDWLVATASASAH